MQASQQYISLPSLEVHGLKIDSTSQLTSIAMTISPSPEAILEFERCCYCTNRRCKCQNEGVVCLDTYSYDERLLGNNVLHEKRLMMNNYRIKYDLIHVTET